MHDLAAGGVGAIALPIELLSVGSERSLCTSAVALSFLRVFFNRGGQGRVGGLVLGCCVLALWALWFLGILFE